MAIFPFARYTTWTCSMPPPRVSDTPTAKNFGTSGISDTYSDSDNCASSSHKRPRPGNPALRHAPSSKYTAVPVQKVATPIGICSDTNDTDSDDTWASYSRKRPRLQTSRPRKSSSPKHILSTESTVNQPTGACSDYSVTTDTSDTDSIDSWTSCPRKRSRLQTSQPRKSPSSKHILFAQPTASPPIVVLSDTLEQQRARFSWPWPTLVDDWQQNLCLAVETYEKQRCPSPCQEHAAENIASCASDHLTVAEADHNALRYRSASDIYRLEYSEGYEQDAKWTLGESGLKSSHPTKHMFALPETTFTAREASHMASRLAAEALLRLAADDSEIASPRAFHHCWKPSETVQLPPVYTRPAQPATGNHDETFPVRRVLEKWGRSFLIEWETGENTWEPKTNVSLELARSFEATYKGFGPGVDRVLSSRRKSSRLQLRLAWSGRPLEEATWIDKSRIDPCWLTR